MTPELVALWALVLAFTFMNGLNDGPILVSTIIFTGTLPARLAFALASAAELVGALAVALSHGANDTQKSTGMLALALLGPAAPGAFEVPWPAHLACALAITAGVAVVGGRVLRLVGSRVYRIRPIHGFAALTCS